MFQTIWGSRVVASNHVATTTRPCHAAERVTEVCSAAAALVGVAKLCKTH